MTTIFRKAPAAPALTEADVRRIAREEAEAAIAKQQDGIGPSRVRFTAF